MKLLIEQAPKITDEMNETHQLLGGIMAIALKKNLTANLQDIRQTVRAERSQNSFQLAKLEFEFQGKRWCVDNYSETGIAVFIPERPLEKLVTQAKIFLKEQCLYSGQVHCAWARQQEGKWYAGFHLSEGHLPENLFLAIGFFDELDRKLDENLKGATLLPESFTLATAQLKAYLQTAKVELDAIEFQLGSQSAETHRSFEITFETILVPKMLDFLREMNRKIDGVYKNLDKSIRKQCASYFRQEVGDYYLAAPFIHRAMEKPQGYAGDYEMMNQIYDNRSYGRGLFARFMHLYGINEYSSQSVRYRKGYFMEQFQKQLREKSGYLLFGSLACGPAREIVDFLKVTSQEDLDRIEFYLMDQDYDALLSAKKNINRVLMERGLRSRISFAPISVKNFLERSGAIELIQGKQFDLIYTAGLYDYLTQPIAKSLTSELLGRLGSTGKLIIGNFHPNNPTKTIAELSSDWRLIHRDETAMLDLVEPGAAKKCHIHMDDLKIDVFLEVDK